MTVIISLDECTAISPSCIANILQGNRLPKGGIIWQITNELKPANFYCYLQAKFGDPNGVQNFFRMDDSDNLIHWEWTLAHKKGLISIMGMNMRTEVHLMGDWKIGEHSVEQFIEYIKRDYKNYGKEMSKFRKECLEHWDIFTNPYHGINAAITQLIQDLDNLDLNPANEKLPNPSVPSEYKKFTEKWNSLMERYNRGIGIAMGIKSLTPVLAESFINLIIYVLCRPDIKKNDRLYQAFVRSNIDVKIQSLHINCIGFKSSVNWTAEPCIKYNSIVNERNDLLHGNINIDKLKFQDMYFRTKVPIFKEYQTFWQQSIERSITSSGLLTVKDGLMTIRELEAYVLSLLEDGLEEQMKIIMAKRDLGLNRTHGRIGILLPDHVVDFGISIIQGNSQ